MPYAKFKPQKQWGRYFTRTFRHKSRVRNQTDRLPYYIDPAVAKANIPIYNPLDPNFFKSSEPAIDYQPPAHLRPVVESEHPLYKATRSYLYNGTVPLTDGVDEACVIANALPARPLPDDLLARHALDILLPTNFAERVRDAIMHGERYDPTFVKLPRRFDPIIFWHNYSRYYGSPVEKRNEVILNDLYRITTLTLLSKLQSTLGDLRCDFAVPLSGFLSERLSGISKPLVFQLQPYMVVQAERPLEPIASVEEVDQTSLFKTPNIYPICPTIDLRQTNVYNDLAVVPRPYVNSLHIHTTLTTRVQDQKYPWTTEQNAANAVLNCFAAALAEATRHGRPAENDALRLRRPVLAKTVQIVNGRLDLVVVQLNTLNLTRSSAGIKNLVWLEKGLPLYKPKLFWENMLTVEQFDYETVKKFVGFLLYR